MLFRGAFVNKKSTLTHRCTHVPTDRPFFDVAFANRYDVDRSKLLFFDDSVENVRQARTMLVSAHIAAPFTQEHERLIYEHLDLHLSQTRAPRP
jgi:hypothetical protein